MKTKVIFGNDSVRKAFDNLDLSKSEDKRLHNWLVRAFTDLEKDAFCGTQIPKKLIPKYYVLKFGLIDNLWKYNLPNAWRIIYTIKREKVIVISVILEWMNHTNYERRFGY